MSYFKKYPFSGEVLLVIVSAIIVFFVAKEIDTLEVLYDTLQQYEKYELDEFLTVSVFLVFALAVFSIRRWQEVLLLNRETRKINDELKTALNEIRVLQGILPICANCKKIRDDQGAWQDVAMYIRDHSEVEFTHGICPECMEKLYPEYSKRTRKQEP